MRFFFTAFILILPLLLAAGGLRITDSSRAGASALRKAALAYSLADCGDIRIDRMAASQAERLLPQNLVDIAVFENRDIPEHLKNSERIFIGREVLTIYVNAANPITDLTSSKLSEIFSEVRPRWSGFGGAMRDIHRINLKPAAESGKLDWDIFQKQPAAEVAGVECSRDIVQLVAADADALGFGLMTQLIPNVRIISVDGVLPSAENLRKNRYPLVKNYFLFVIKPSEKTEKFINFVKKQVSE